GVQRTFMPVPPLSAGRPHLLVTGFMGTGKSTAGALAANMLSLPFVDLDRIVEKREGSSISEIFARNGESRFRTLEAEAMTDAALLSGAVIATGGGGVLHASGFAHLAQDAVVAVLTALPSRLEERLGGASVRPKLDHRGSGTLTALLQEREPLYQVAGDELDTSFLSAEETASHLAARYRPVVNGPTRLSIDLRSAEAHPIVVGERTLQSLETELERMPAPSGMVAVVDPSVADRVAPILAGLADGAPVATIELTGGESSKSLNVVQKLWGDFKTAGLDRSGIVIAIGGGALLDTTGFAAATYMRGVRLVNVPTTLLAMVDAGLGGKVGIDYGGIKNNVGVLHQPELVLIDPELLSSLPTRELRCGMAEIVKAAVLASPLLLDLLEEAPLDGRGVPIHLEWYIEQAVRIKAAYVAADPSDDGVRQSLNLGHTFAHGVEAASGYRVPHGEAVAVGLVAAAHLAAETAGSSAASADRIARLLERFGLPTSLPSRVSRSAVLRAMSQDKKWHAGKGTFVLPARGGAELASGIEPDAAVEAMASSSATGSQRSAGEKPPLRIMVLHGPNLNLMGTREPEVYGTTTLAEIDTALKRRASELAIELACLQSNIEGELIDAIQAAPLSADAIVINPGGYSHTSVAIRDAIAAVGLPTVEVHVTNPSAREDFRTKAVVASACQGVVSGFGWQSYLIAIDALVTARREAESDADRAAQAASGC
ncbi:MAG: 3-dehydroquinate synthase, partial [Actinomycetota bacterium]|nr:3-dehydroquinate synthase [Actinomycetota bacterium]